MKYKVELYKGRKVVWELEIGMRDENFIKELKNGVIFYDTGYPTGNTEIYYLKNYDRVVINGGLFYEPLIDEIDEQEKENI